MSLCGGGLRQLGVSGIFLTNILIILLNAKVSRALLDEEEDEQAVSQSQQGNAVTAAVRSTVGRNQ
jgi:hypothetical protein